MKIIRNGRQMKYKEIFTGYLITPERNRRFLSLELSRLNKSQLILRIVKYLTSKIPELGARAGANDVLENSPEERALSQLLEKESDVSPYDEELRSNLRKAPLNRICPKLNREYETERKRRRGSI